MFYSDENEYHSSTKRDTDDPTFTIQLCVFYFICNQCFLDLGLLRSIISTLFE